MTQNLNDIKFFFPKNKNQCAVLYEADCDEQNQSKNDDNSFVYKELLFDFREMRFVDEKKIRFDDVIFNIFSGKINEQRFFRYNRRIVKKIANEIKRNHLKNHVWIDYVLNRYHIFIKVLEKHYVPMASICEISVWDDWKKEVIIEKKVSCLENMREKNFPYANVSVEDFLNDKDEIFTVVFINGIKIHEKHKFFRVYSDLIDHSLFLCLSENKIYDSFENMYVSAGLKNLLSE